MSTTRTRQPTGLNGDRIADKAHRNLEALTRQFQQRAEDNATVAYDERFWDALQTQLESIATQYRIVLSEKNHDAARDFRDIEQLGVLTAVEEFRGRVQDDPYKVQDADLWDDFRHTIFHAVETPFPVA